MKNIIVALLSVAFISLLIGCGSTPKTGGDVQQMATDINSNLDQTKSELSSTYKENLANFRAMENSGDEMKMGKAKDLRKKMVVMQNAARSIRKSMADIKAKTTRLNEIAAAGQDLTEQQQAEVSKVQGEIDGLRSQMDSQVSTFRGAADEFRNIYAEASANDAPVEAVPEPIQETAEAIEEGMMEPAAESSDPMIDVGNEMMDQEMDAGADGSADFSDFE